MGCLVAFRPKAAGEERAAKFNYTAYKRPADCHHAHDDATYMVSPHSQCSDGWRFPRSYGECEAAWAGLDEATTLATVKTIQDCSGWEAGGRWVAGLSWCVRTTSPRGAG